MRERIKQLLYVALSLSLVLASLSYSSISVEADGEEIATETVSDGLVTDGAGNYWISSAEGLVAFAALVNNGSTKINGYITQDINMEGVEYTPIGTGYGNTFKGIFDGQGYTISNLTIEGNYTGLVGYAEGAVIKNIYLADVKFNATLTAGGICATVYQGVDIRNCHVSGTIEVRSSDYTSGRAGGIVGLETGWGSLYPVYITDCSSTSDITVCLTSEAENDWSAKYYGAMAGGIIADQQEYITYITNCYNLGTISATCYCGKASAGGIAGQCLKTEISNCYNAGNVFANGKTLSYVGAIGGCEGFSSCYTTLTNCYSIDSITSTAYGYVIDGNTMPTATSFTAEQLKSGELTYIMNQALIDADEDAVWGQDLDNGEVDANPVFLDEVYAGTALDTGAAVYTKLDASGYTNILCLALGHTTVTDTIVTDSAVSAACTSTGLTEGSHCSVCGEVIAAQETVAATGHTVVTDAAVAATCTSTGLTEGTHCSVCGEILTAQETVAALGHIVATDAAVAATCTSTGLTEGTHCSVCGEIITAQETVAATGHTIVTDSAVAATTTSTGLTEGSHCSTCGEVFTAQETVEMLTPEPVVEEAVVEEPVIEELNVEEPMAEAVLEEAVAEEPVAEVILEEVTTEEAAIDETAVVEEPTSTGVIASVAATVSAAAATVSAAATNATTTAMSAVSSTTKIVAEAATSIVTGVVSFVTNPAEAISSTIANIADSLTPLGVITEETSQAAGNGWWWWMVIAAAAVLIKLAKFFQNKKTYLTVEAVG